MQTIKYFRRQFIAFLEVELDVFELALVKTEAKPDLLEVGVVPLDLSIVTIH